MLSDLHLAIIINSERFPFQHIISGYYVFIMIYPKPWINGIQTIDRSMTLNLKTIHKCFVCPYKKAELSSMFHCIQIFTNTCEVTVQIKRAIGKAILHKLPNITKTMLCACVEPPQYLAWFVCFPIVIKALLHGFDPSI